MYFPRTTRSPAKQLGLEDEFHRGPDRRLPGGVHALRHERRRDDTGRIPI
jgi:hypothetical protein